jgi:prepilin-type N-terminal cleavage/methylation domain-containing protein
MTGNRRNRSHGRCPGGFTLIELLVVISIISILAGLVVATLPRIIQSSKIVTTQGMLAGIQQALASYRQTHAAFPPDRHPLLDRSSECLVYYLSGPTIVYGPGAPPPTYPWTHSLFRDGSSAGTGRRAGFCYYSFDRDRLVDRDGDGAPELIDPWMTTVLYNAGPFADGPFNQHGAAVHNPGQADLLAAGPDRRLGTQDDIANWNNELPDGYGSVGDHY